MADARIFREYVRKLQAAVSLGNATELTHRTALQTLLESALDGITATNEPKRVECGAPDYAVSRKQGGLTIGYVEAKDIGISLADIKGGATACAINWHRWYYVNAIQVNVRSTLHQRGPGEGRCIQYAPTRDVSRY